MATAKVLGNQKLFEIMCYILMLKVTKFQPPTPDSFLSCIKKTTCGGKSPTKIVLKLKFRLYKIFPLLRNFVKSALEAATYWAIPGNIHTHPMDDIGNPVRNA